MNINKALKSLANASGFNITRQSENPVHTLIGLKQLPIRSIIDIGANEGQFARLIRRQFPSAAIYCFEPLPDPYIKLKQWADTQSNVQTFNIALGETSGSAEMYLHPDHTPSSSLLKTTELSGELYPITSRQQAVRISIETLDQVVASMAAPPPRDILLKLDVQGFEGHVLRGGQQVLSAARACIVEVCLDGLYKGQSSFGEIFKMFDGLSFRYAGNLNQVYSADGHVIYIDAVFVR